ncbi:hypothetical protein SUGI_0111130 [Cryptomeria japonica]|nr:hypothetical protein SUGI_0111130 [Cryptomeria japonica]
MIWMRADLKNLLFEGQGYKTLVKSRDNSTISTTPTTQLYQLPLLCPEDVLSLLCFWAFVQPPIPILRHCRCKYGEGESSVATARAAFFARRLPSESEVGKREAENNQKRVQLLDSSKYYSHTYNFQNNIDLIFVL